MALPSDTRVLMTIRGRADVRPPGSFPIQLLLYCSRIRQYDN